MAITHGTPTVAADDPAYDVSADEWNQAHTVADGSLVAAKTSFTATDKVLGRSTAGAGNGEEITVTAAGRALIDDANAAAQLTTLGAAAAAHSHSGADITSGTVVDARIDAAISRDSELTTHAGAADPHTVYQKESEKGAANGYAGLGAGALVPVAQLASGTPDGTKFVRDDGVLAVPSTTGGTIVVKEVDGTPTITASTVRFPNGTLVDDGGGQATYTPAAGGLNQSFLGYNTIGGSLENTTIKRWYMKKITVPTAGILTSIDCYIKWAADDLGAIACMVAEDVAGVIGKSIGASTVGVSTALVDLSEAVGTRNPRWFSLPSGLYVPAADYWIGVAFVSGTNNPVLYYDGSGSDRYFTPGVFVVGDPPYHTITTSANRYSIRASYIS